MKEELILDTETGGINPHTDALLQIAAITRVSKNRINMFIEHDKSLRVTVEAASINGYPQSYDGKSKINEADAIFELFKFIKLHNISKIWCHNAPFDASFLKAALSRANIAEQLPRFRCTQTMADTLNSIGGLPVKSLSLSSIAAELCPTIKRKEKHDAMDDAEITLACLEEMQHRFQTMADMANSYATNNMRQTYRPTRKSAWAGR